MHPQVPRKVSAWVAIRSQRELAVRLIWQHRPVAVDRAKAAGQRMVADRRAFDAHTAQAAGLLNYVVPAAELDAKVDWLISRIVDKSPTAIRRGKYAMRAIASMSFDESIAYTESQIALLAMTEDAKEGLKAFGEKRKPSWPGK